MRHKFPIGISRFTSRNYGREITEPHIILNFKHPRKNSAGPRIVAFIANNPFCTRRQILEAVMQRKDYTCGQHSCTFSNLLWRDYIDYDSKYRYVVRSAGLEYLKRAGYKLMWA